MAYSHVPTFVAKGAYASGTAALTVAVPAGYRNNDMLILVVESANQAIVAPAGWTEFTGSPQSTGTAAAAGGVRLGVFYKIVGGAEASVTVADTGDHTAAIMMAFRGVDPAAPIHLTAGSVDATATTAMSWPTLTTTVNNCRIIMVSGLDQDIAGTAQVGAITAAGLTGITEHHDQTVASGAGGGLHVASGIRAVAGAIGAMTATGAASTTHAYLTIALKGRSDAIVLPRGQYKPDYETVIATGSGQSVTNDGVILQADVSPVWELDTPYTPKAEVENIATAFDGVVNTTNPAFIPESSNVTYNTRGGSLEYDSLNDQYVFWGGFDGTTRYTNVWVRDCKEPGQPWRRQTTTGTAPVAANLAASAYFISGGAGHFVVWGGNTGADSQQMLILNTNTWAWRTVTQTNAPTARSYITKHIAVKQNGTTDATLYFFGGWGAARENNLHNVVVNSTTTAATWTTLLATGAVGSPAIRSGALLDYKASTNKLYLYGGFDGTTYLNDFWSYDIVGNTWTQEAVGGTAPVGTEILAGGYDAVNNRFWFTGGWTGTQATGRNNVGYINDVGGTETFVEVRAFNTDNQHYASHSSSANCIDTKRGWLVMFGMMTKDSTERYSFAIDFNDGITTNKPVYGLNEGDYMSARDAMAGVFDPDRNDWLQIGGFAGMANDTTILQGTHVNDIWAYDYVNNRWRFANKGNLGMPHTEGATAVYDTLRDRVIVFGGLSGINETGNEVWSATSDANGMYKWQKLNPTGTPPTSRWLSAGVYDATNDRVIITLGGKIGGPLNETWELSFSSSPQGVWTQRTPTGTVTAVMGPGYADKTSTKQLYIFGGATNQALTTVSAQLVYLDYSTTNGAWVTPTSSGGTARRTPALGYDSVNDRLITFGGFNGTASIEVLSYWNVTTPGAWANAAPTATRTPDARRSLAGAVLPDNNFYVAHGRSDSSMWYRNTWQLTPNYATPNSSTWLNEMPRVFQPHYFIFDNNTAGSYHWQAWTTEEAVDHTKVSYGGNAESVADFVLGASGSITIRTVSKKVWVTNAWVAKPVKYWNGTAWVTKVVKVWSGGP